MWDERWQWCVKVVGRGWVVRSVGFPISVKDKDPKVFSNKDDAYALARKVETHYAAMSVSDAEVIVLKRSIKTVIGPWEVD